MAQPPLCDLVEAVGAIPDGATVAIGRPSATPLVEELVRQRKRRLHLIGVPTGGEALEALVAAGCAASVESSGVDLGEKGRAPAFTAAVENGGLRMFDSSCPALLAALQAGASGVSFAPVRGLIGSDLLVRRTDFKVIDDPYQPGGKIVLVPALRPRYALLQGRRADLEGNVVIGIQYDDRLVAQATHHVIYAVPEVNEQATCRLAADEQIVPADYVEHLVLA